MYRNIAYLKMSHASPYEIQVLQMRKLSVASSRASMTSNCIWSAGTVMKRRIFVIKPNLVTYEKRKRKLKTKKKSIVLDTRCSIKVLIFIIRRCAKLYNKMVTGWSYCNTLPSSVGSRGQGGSSPLTFYLGGHNIVRPPLKNRYGNTM